MYRTSIGIWCLIDFGVLSSQNLLVQSSRAMCEIYSELEVITPERRQ